MSEKLRIWAEIKKQAPAILKAGGNPIDLLLWSQGKTLGNICILSYHNRFSLFIIVILYMV